MEDGIKSVSHHVETDSAQAPSVPAANHGRQKTTWHMVIFAFCIGLFGWVANFDNAFGGIVLTMDPYKKAFGQCVTTPRTDGNDPIETCSLTALQQSLIQLTTLFMAFGGLASGVVGDYLGRRMTLQAGCLLIAVGAAGMLGTAGSFLNYMVCKCIGGVGIGMLFAAGPVWGSESVAPDKRGLLMSFWNVGLASGNVVAAATCVGSSKIANNWSWQTPIICQIPTAVILVGVSFCFNESPRWLMSKGKEEKARKSFGKFNDLDPYSPGVDWLVNEVTQHINLERALSEEASFKQLFHGSDLKRTHIALLALVGNALTGIMFVIPYTALFLSQMGLANPYALNVAISSCVLAGTIPGPFLCEYVGRRLSLLGGYSVMGGSMLILAAIASALGQDDPTAKNALVAFLCIWAFTFGATSGPISFVSSAEMHSLRLRTVGQAYAIGIYEIFNFGAAFWTPYMLSPDYGNMGTNVGYFYAGITVAVIIATYLFLPETARLSLEQVDEYFATGEKAWNTSLAKNKKIVGRPSNDISEKLED